MRVSLVVAADEKNVIGGKKRLLWHLPADLKHFKNLTVGKPVIMGRKTHESIGKVLPGRRNIVVTRASREIPGCSVVHSLEEALRLAESDGAEEAMVIGGGEIYRQALPLAQTVYLTRVHGTFAGDVTFPELASVDWQEVSCEHHEADERNPYTYTFLTYRRRARKTTIR